MALNKSQAMALYLLMGTHGRSPGDMSALYNAVVSGTPQGQDFKPALLAAAQQIDNRIQPGDIGGLPDLSGDSLRRSLGLILDYPGGTSCLDDDDGKDAYVALNPDARGHQGE